MWSKVNISECPIFCVECDAPRLAINIDKSISIFDFKQIAIRDKNVSPAPMVSNVFRLNAGDSIILLFL